MSMCHHQLISSQSYGAWSAMALALVGFAEGEGDNCPGVHDTIIGAIFASSKSVLFKSFLSGTIYVPLPTS